MRICLITAAHNHPLLAAVTDLLADRHQVLPLDPGKELRLPAQLARHARLADVYLLKSRTPAAISLAAGLEERGARVLNSASATALCQDRTEMAALAHCAGLPFAGTRTFGSLTELLAEPAETTAAPLVIKSRHSRSEDLVARTDSPEAVRELAAGWPKEPVVVQEFTENSGWDHKLWAVGDQLFAGLRRSELSPGGRGPTHSLTLAELPSGWVELVLRVGQVFGLDIYGVDLLDTGDGHPLIVDINAFPGIRAQPGAPEAVAELALRTASGTDLGRGRGRGRATGTGTGAGTGTGTAVSAPWAQGR